MTEVAGTVVAGHGVASGRAGDPRFPGGTIAAQAEAFRARGVDLAGYHPGTLNVATGTPLPLVHPDHVLADVTWHPDMPAETFRLWHVRLRTTAREVAALVYQPDPDTKPEHHQPADVVEVMAPWLEEVASDPAVVLVVPDDRLAPRR